MAKTVLKTFIRNSFQNICSKQFLWQELFLKHLFGTFFMARTVPKTFVRNSFYGKNSFQNICSIRVFSQESSLKHLFGRICMAKVYSEQVLFNLKILFQAVLCSENTWKLELFSKNSINKEQFFLWQLFRAICDKLFSIPFSKHFPKSQNTTYIPGLKYQIKCNRT